MSESESHKKAKAKAAGKKGVTEKKIKGGKRLDAVTRNKATEVERSGTREGLLKASRRLKASGKKQKVLQVPEKDMRKAVSAMREVNVSGSVKNMSNTKRRSVRALDGKTNLIGRRKPKSKTQGTGARIMPKKEE